jgi:hypothetical protein
MTIDVTVDAGGGGDHTTFAAAIAALPAPAGWVDDYRILFLDSSTYSFDHTMTIDATVHPLVVEPAVGETPTIIPGAGFWALRFYQSSFITFNRMSFTGTAGAVPLDRGIHSVVSDLTFNDCIITCATGTAIGFGGGGAGSGNRMVFNNCTVQSTASGTLVALDSAGCDDCIIRGCLLKDAQVLLGLTNGTNFIFDRNRVENVTNTGLNIVTSVDVVITNNIFDRLVTGNGVIQLQATCTGFEIFNNTFSTVGAGAGHAINVMAASSTGGAIKNNTFLMDDVSASYAISHIAAAAADIDYNIYWRTGTPGSPGNNVCFETSARTFVAWQGLGHDANGQEIDPQHTDEATGDYTPLNFTANTVGAGVNLASVVLDYLGNTRPVLVQDVGAYEALNAGPFLSSVSPANLATGVGVGDTIDFTIEEPIDGVDMTTLVIKIRHNGGPEVVAYNGGLGFQSPYNGGLSDVTPDPTGNPGAVSYAVVIDPDPDFGSLDTVIVRVECDDLETPTPKSLDTTYSFTLEDNEGPTLQFQDPAPGAVDVDGAGLIRLDVVDPSGVDLTTLQVRLNTILAFDGNAGGAQAGYDGAGSGSTVITNGFTVVMAPTTPYPDETIITVQVDVDDLAP